jgi:large subunit ribosomal protein L25
MRHMVCISAEWSREADRQMPGRPTLVANERTVIGKKVKHLRRQGMVPAIIYGTLVDKPIPVSIDGRDLQRTYIDYGNISLIDVELDGDSYTVYIRTLQQHPVSRAPLHAELFAPNLLVKMSASIPIILVGESPNADGAITQLRDSVEMEGLPTDLPGAVEVDVSSLEEIEDTVWVGDLTMPTGVELLTDPEEPIVRLMAVRLEVEEEGVEAEAAEGEEGAEEEAEPAAEQE